MCLGDRCESIMSRGPLNLVIRLRGLQMLVVGSRGRLMSNVTCDLVGLEIRP